MKVPILTLSNVLMSICQIPHVIFQTISQLFFKFCILFSVIKDNSSVLFLVFGQMLNTFNKRDKSQWKFSRIECSDQNSPNSCPFWNKKSLSLQILQHSFSIMRNNSSVLFQLKLYIFSAKEVYQSTKFGKFHLSSRKAEILHFDGLLL